jgi:hypothetical protein
VEPAPGDFSPEAKVASRPTGRRPARPPVRTMRAAVSRIERFAPASASFGDALPCAYRKAHPLGFDAERGSTLTANYHLENGGSGSFGLPVFLRVFTEHRSGGGRARASGRSSPGVRIWKP